jgi:hypothetical protein
VRNSWNFRNDSAGVELCKSIQRGLFFSARLQIVLNV